MCYSGEYYDKESDLIYLRARYYDPSSGRFTTEDPAKDGTNWYIYCYNNPVTLTDPMGTAPGDKYKTMEDAAKDWATENYSKTAYSQFEMVSLIYSTVDEKGNTYYSYTMPIYGDEPHKTTPKDAKSLLPTGATVSGVVHSHTSNKTLETRHVDESYGFKGIGEFSQKDAEYIRDNGGIAFLVYPNLADDKLVNISRLDYTSSNGKYTATGVSYRQPVNSISYYDKRHINMRLRPKLDEHIQKGTCPTCFVQRR